MKGSTKLWIATGVASYGYLTYFAFRDGIVTYEEPGIYIDRIWITITVCLEIVGIIESLVSNRPRSILGVLVLLVSKLITKLNNWANKHL